MVPCGMHPRHSPATQRAQRSGEGRKTGTLKISAQSGPRPTSRNTDELWNFGAVVCLNRSHQIVMLPLVKRLLAKEERIQPDAEGALKMKERGNAAYKVSTRSMFYMRQDLSERQNSGTSLA